MDYNNEPHVELYHHGIKGQKWGVRRFQNKDGSLTPAGKKRYDDDASESPKPAKKQKVTHRMRLEKKYRESGMSDEEAAKAADRRIKTEKVIAVTAGVTVAACTAWYAKNKWSETYCDQVLKSGTTFHNLDSAANPRPGEHLYVNYRKNDTDYFRGHFAINKMRKSETGNAFNHVITATEDIKIPSLKTRKSVFKQLYDSDEQFRETFNTHSNLPKGTNSSKLAYKMMWPKFGDKNNPEFNTAKHKYFEALRQKGYEAIVDELDSSKNVFRADAPLILLNTSSKSLGEMKISELTSKDVLLSQANARYYRTGRDLMTAASLPHTNHFKESTKRVERALAKSNKNSKYIDKAITEQLKVMKDRNMSVDAESYLRKQALKRKGVVLADVGKYMTKYDKLTFEQASKIASSKRAVTSTMKTASYYGLMASPVVAISAYDKNRYVRNYLNEHPNTKKTYSEISKMYIESKNKR